MSYPIDYYKKYEPIFGCWKIVKEIGHGSFGKVFEIQREDYGITYSAALKIITVPASEDEYQNIIESGFTKESAATYFGDIVKSTVKEFALMASLKGNTNIVNYEDHVVYEHEDGLGWDILIRMELLRPINKHTIDTALAEKDIIKLGIDICRALELCRKRNIIHRDIKPENIFINDNGDYKLGDFGIARMAEKTQSGMTKTGTLTYMAPEIYKGEKYGPSVDIYSLGIVMYRLLNHNRAPFLPPYPQSAVYSDMEAAFEKRIKGEPFPAPSGECSKELCDIIFKACSYKPEDRFASAQEMKEALENIGKLHPPAVVSDDNLSNAIAVTPPITYTAPSEETQRVVSTQKAKKRKKSKIPLVLTAVALGVAGILVRSIIDLGQKCGDNLYWELSDDGTLTIVGEGEMDEWEYSDSVPWYNKRGSIKTVILDSGVTSIGDYAFDDCDSLTSITIPDSVTSIGDYAFFHCDALTSISIPDSVTSIGYVAFAWCKSLASITISDGVTSIGDDAFAWCNSLTSISIPDSVTSIGDSAFISCDSLTSISIPDSVTSIGDSAFEGCDSLTSISIPDNVTSIGDCAFNSCDSLTSISIPNSVTFIGDSAFNSCDSLTSINFHGTKAQWDALGLDSSDTSNATITYAKSK